MARKRFAAVKRNGIIYAIGGSSDKNKTTNTVEKYDAGEDM